MLKGLIALLLLSATTSYQISAFHPGRKAILPRLKHPQQQQLSNPWHQQHHHYHQHQQTARHHAITTRYLANKDLIGEDAATFSLSEQKISSWVQFSVAVSAVMISLFYVWIYPYGPEWGNDYKDIMESLAGGDSTITITLMLGFFAVVHSGLASLRPWGEEVIGAKPWRYIFAISSLPLAFSAIVYFINHRYDGVHLWDLRTMPGMHDFVFWTSLVSFLFLYPSTFNLLEIAAVDEPKVHLWETGVMRITRHPQAIGQLICAEILPAHHLFAVWNGDRRLRDKYGEKAEILQNRTSVIPFAAIISGKQKLPENYHEELLRLPYLAIIAGSFFIYYAHPYMQVAASQLHW
eukprot:scaffold1290_cov248-Ochromonas_danica.AAC.40